MSLCFWGHHVVTRRSQDWHLYNRAYKYMSIVVIRAFYFSVCPPQTRYPTDVGRRKFIPFYVTLVQSILNSDFIFLLFTTTKTLSNFDAIVSDVINILPAEIKCSRPWILNMFWIIGLDFCVGNFCSHPFRISAFLRSLHVFPYSHRLPLIIFYLH